MIPERRKGKAKKQSKMLWLNAIFAALTVVEASIGIIRDTVGPQWYLAIIGALAATNYYLRTITTQPVGK